MSTKYCYNTWERHMCIGFSDRVWRLIPRKKRDQENSYMLEQTKVSSLIFTNGQSSQGIFCLYGHVLGDPYPNKGIPGDDNKCDLERESWPCGVMLPILPIQSISGSRLLSSPGTWPWVRVGDPPTIWERTMLPGHNWEVWDPQSREKSASLQSLLALKGVPGGMAGLDCLGPDKT